MSARSLFICALASSLFGGVAMVPVILQMPTARAADDLAATDESQDPFDGESSQASDEDDADDNESIKESHRNLYMRFLEQEGYKPEIDSEGDVAFKKEGFSYFISVTEDREFFRVAFPGFYKIESVAEHFLVLQAVEQANREVKVAKLVIVGDYVWAVAESFVNDQSEIEGIFNNSLLALRAGRDRLLELMQE